ncbi:MAG: nucleotidyltransferase family protein [Robiginitomaculum sp.]|nr:nucleotidyltransferase family protein [Robiginitomaculum sp.]
MVMAAGHGTRLRPHTNHICKALVKVGGKPLIDHMLDRLSAVGIRRAVINVHAFADELEAHLKHQTNDLEIIISDERDQLLETGGGVVKALPLLGTEPILICNIDAIWRRRNVLENLIKAWDATYMDELLLLTDTNKTIGFAGAGDFYLDPDYKLRRRDKGGAPYVYAGVQIFKPKLAVSFPKEKFSRNLIWNESLKRGKLYGHVMNGVWMHVGDPQALEITEAMLA